MKQRAITGITLIMLLIGMLTLTLDIQPVKASGTIYIRADGSVDPDTAPISSADNVTYTFTGDITYPTYYRIEVERSNIIIDGNGYTFRGSGEIGAYGFWLEGMTNVVITDTNIEEWHHGVWLDSSSFITVSGNTMTDNYFGVYSIFSNSNEISGNTITNIYAYYGDCLFLYESSNNTISGNTMTNSNHGIWLYKSCNYNRVSGNTMTNNTGRGIWLDESSSCNSISENTITKNHVGIGCVDWSSNNTISGNTITNCSAPYGVGCGFANSSFNIVSGNTITNSGYGFALYLVAFNNTVSGNTITNNDYGIHIMDSCSNNAFFNNSITNNNNGTWFFESSNNKFYRNDFINNTEQVYDYSWDHPETAPSVNTWDNGYPYGGNYWSDYTDVDQYHGPYQNETGSDQIWDHPYVIDENNTDNYPLIGPWAPYNVVIKAHCHTEDIDVNVPISKDGSPTPYTTPHTFTGLIGTHQFTVLNTDPNGHPFIQWSTGETSTTITVTTGGTYTSYYGITDVAVTNVTLSKTLVGQGYCVNITVTVENQGNLTETFGVVAPHFDGVVIPTSVQWEIFWSMGDVNRDGYIDDKDVDLVAAAWASTPGDPNWNPDADLNQDLIVDIIDLFSILTPNLGLNIWTYNGLPLPPKGTQRGVKLYPGNQTALTFTWNTTGFAKGNYTITAYANPVLGETDTGDNSFTDGTVRVNMVGDVAPEYGLVDIVDVVYVAINFGAERMPNGTYWHMPPCDRCPHNPNADLNSDGVIDIVDIVIIAIHFGETDP